MDADVQRHLHDPFRLGHLYGNTQSMSLKVVSSRGVDDHTYRILCDQSITLQVTDMLHIDLYKHTEYIRPRRTPVCCVW